MTNENAIWWILGISVIGLIITFIGIGASMNLPAQEKKNRIRKFAAIAVALMAFTIPIFKPFVSSYSSAGYMEELKAENLNSPEDFAQFEKTQSRQIERLKTDIKELREDLYVTNLYYSTLTGMFTTALGVIALNFAFRKRKSEDDDLEEIQPDQFGKL